MFAGDVGEVAKTAWETWVVNCEKSLGSTIPEIPESPARYRRMQLKVTRDYSEEGSAA
jgi:hypothetical protein